MEPTDRPRQRDVAITAAAVFVVCVIVRVPSCYESFWLDELHTAWTVWGTLGDVTTRADIGHQTPFYFFGVWFWKQLVGETEVALRLSSVLAVAIASAVQCVAVARWSASVIAGAASGLVLCLEPNSLFFGTELRPYAFVILFTSLALACWLRLTSTKDPGEFRRVWSWLVAMVLLACLVQPTAVGVLIWLPISALGWSIRLHRGGLTSWGRPSWTQITWGRKETVLAVVVAVTGFAVWRLTLGESWSQRTIWTSFATATHARQIWQAWDWTWLLLIPLCSAMAVWLATRSRAIQSSGATRSGATGSGTSSTTPGRMVAALLALAGIAVLSTTLSWWVSFMRWIPVWHLRYFVGVLPILSCLVGGCVAVVQWSLPVAKWRSAVTLLFALVVTLWPSFRSGQVSSLSRYPVALVHRGEDWRSAVAWIRDRVQPNDEVLLDAGLIEAAAWIPTFAARPDGFDELTKRRSEFLTFPVRGPYFLRQPVLPLGRNLRDLEASVQRFAANRGQVYVLSRRPPVRVDPSLIQQGWRVNRFGNLTVLSRSMATKPADG